MSKINVTILGTTAGVPTRERAHATIHVSYYERKEFCCLFDCGEGAQRQLMIGGLNLMKIDNIFITHWHGDHCLGVPGLVDTMGFEDRVRPLTVYAPEARRVRRCINSSVSMGNFKVISRDVPAKGKRITRLLDTERFSILTVPVNHGIPAVAYALVEKDKRTIDTGKAVRLGLPEKSEIYARLKEKGVLTVDGRQITFDEVSMTKKGKKIVYSGDTEICDNLRKLAKGADLLIQDCTYFDDFGKEKPHRHSSLPEVVKMVSEEGVKRTILTHISRKYQDKGFLESLIKDYAGLELAEDFMKITV
ncbi:MAG: MBL fold metallo-hydrolase [Candidatus Omnitrophota bacterium]|nr:MBL fold metallo-hydrolase [Candidatus Omnitrophota bacterium]